MVEGVVLVFGQEEVVHFGDERDELVPSPKLGGEALLQRSLAVLAEVPFGGLHEIGNRKLFNADAELVQEELVVVVVHLRPGDDEQRGLGMTALDSPPKSLRVSPESRALLEELNFIAGAVKRPSRPGAGNSTSNDSDLLRHASSPMALAKSASAPGRRAGRGV